MSGHASRVEAAASASKKKLLEAINVYKSKAKRTNKKLWYTERSEPPINPDVQKLEDLATAVSQNNPESLVMAINILNEEWNRTPLGDLNTFKIPIFGFLLDRPYLISLCNDEIKMQVSAATPQITAARELEAAREREARAAIEAENQAAQAKALAADQAAAKKSEEARASVLALQQKLASPPPRPQTANELLKKNIEDTLKDNISAIQEALGVTPEEKHEEKHEKMGVIIGGTLEFLMVPKHTNIAKIQTAFAAVAGNKTQPNFFKFLFGSSIMSEDEEVDSVNRYTLLISLPKASHDAAHSTGSGGANGGAGGPTSPRTATVIAPVSMGEEATTNTTKPVIDAIDQYNARFGTKFRFGPTAPVGELKSALKTYPMVPERVAEAINKLGLWDKPKEERARDSLKEPVINFLTAHPKICYFCDKNTKNAVNPSNPAADSRTLGI